MLNTKYLCGQMLINQIDTKQTGKFCKNFISKIYQCIENFSLIEVVEISTIPLPPGYVGLLVSRSKQVTKIVWSDEFGYYYIKSTFLSFILLKISLHCHKTILTKEYLASFDK